MLPNGALKSEPYGKRLAAAQPIVRPRAPIPNPESLTLIILDSSQEIVFVAGNNPALVFARYDAFTVNHEVLSLVVLAAGLGSRFGGLKQLAPVGPNGEAILDYTIWDACRCGVAQVVLIVRSEILEVMREHIERFHPHLDVVYVLQDQSDAPKRARPWGTAHALLCASPHLQGRFLVVNADDRYGPNALRVALETLCGTSDHVLVGYPIEGTLPPSGAVSRAQLQAAPDGQHLESIQECHGIHRDAHGRIHSDHGEIPVGTLVSMNLWGFQPSLVPHLREGWTRFLEAHRHDERTEFLLPSLIADLMRSGQARVRLVGTQDAWVGLTNPEDLELVRAKIRELEGDQRSEGARERS